MPETVRTQPFRLDYDDAARIHLAKTRPQMLTILAPVLFLAFISLIGWAHVPWYLAILIVVGAAALGFVAQPVRLRKVLARPAFAAGFRERTIEVTPESLHQLNEDGINSTVPLTSFLSASIVREHYVLTLTPSQYVLVPQRAFASPSDEEEFKAYIRAAVPKVIGF